MPAVVRSCAVHEPARFNIGREAGPNKPCADEFLALDRRFVRVLGWCRGAPAFRIIYIMSNYDLSLVCSYSWSQYVETKSGFAATRIWGFREICRKATNSCRGSENRTGQDRLHRLCLLPYSPANCSVGCRGCTGRLATSLRMTSFGCHRDSGASRGCFRLAVATNLMAVEIGLVVERVRQSLPHGRQQLT